MSEPMSDERLERLAGLAELPCTCQDADCGNYASALTAQEARELVAEVKRGRAQLAKLRTEYGARVTYTDTLTAEGPIADTLDEALEALAAFDAKGHTNVVSRELVEREVTEWHGVKQQGES
jgi:hypothetical protein